MTRLIFKAEAKRRLQDHGISKDVAAMTVKKMPKILIGKSWKIRLDVVDDAIALIVRGPLPLPKSSGLSTRALRSMQKHGVL